jgi:hypothetical protein
MEELHYRPSSKSNCTTILIERKSTSTANYSIMYATFFNDKHGKCVPKSEVLNKISENADSSENKLY